ncbi:MAG: HEAT repeat domain-containing protein, partial [Kiritimatiellales bacterium]
MRQWILFLSLIISSLSPAFAATPDPAEIRSDAVNVLQTELRQAEQWQKVHAAEALLKLGYIAGVEDEFLKELSLYENQPQYRIGIWRVLVRTAVTPREQQQWIEKIKTVLLDSSAPDRMHAAETLGKLNIRLNEQEKALTEEYAQQMQDPFACWLLAQHGSAAGVQQLEQLQQSDDPVTAFRAGFCLEQLEKISSGTTREDAVTALADSNDAKKTAAAYALGSLGMPEDRALLLPLLSDFSADVRIAAAESLLRLERQRTGRLGFIDWLVLGGYFFSLILIGAYYARKAQTADDYLLGGRNMKAWMVGLSLFAALLSTASYMSVPGEIVKHGPMILAQLTAIPLIIWVVGWFLIPTFMKLRVTSANEILEMNLGLSVRM